MTQLVCRKMIVQAAVHRRVCALMLIYSSDCRQRWRLCGPPGYRVRFRDDAIHFEKILPITLSSAVWVISNGSNLGVNMASINVRCLRSWLLWPAVLVIVVVLHQAGISLLIGLVRVPARACEIILLLLLSWSVGIMRLRCVLRVNRMLDSILFLALSSGLLVHLTGQYLASRHRASKRILLLFVRHRWCHSQAT